MYIVQLHIYIYIHSQAHLWPHVFLLYMFIDIYACIHLYIFICVFMVTHMHAYTLTCGHVRVISSYTDTQT